jgi:monoamine oxidase
MVHTIIVGAGIAGLWLALELARRDHQVTVLEKYDYIGGRVLTSKKHHVEIGAGRIHDSHSRVGALVDHYKLTRIPLNETTAWISRKSRGIPEPNDFEPTWTAICDQIALLPPSILSTHTLRDLAVRIMGPKEADAFLERFPYRAELNTMRADLGLQSFRGGDMGTSRGYYVVREGLSTLINRQATEGRRAGVQIRTGAEVTHIDGTTVHLKGRSKIHGDSVILATHVVALQKILPEIPWSRYLTMEPLTRIYAQYPAPAWFADLPKFVTDSPLRYVIPVGPTTIMISYTDADDTRWWRGLKGKALQRAIQSELRVVFPDRDIPDPIWIKAYEWSEGCTYWRPGDYDPATVANQLSNPAPNVYVCGESLSVGHQAWMEGALTTASTLLEHYLPNQKSNVA